jgi:hypothetical protein
VKKVEVAATGIQALARCKALATSVTDRRAFVVLGFSAGLASCASLGLTSWRLGRDEINAMVQRRFPRRQRVLDSVDLTLSDPVVDLVPSQQRLRSALKYEARVSALFPSLQGRIVLLHSLRLEPKDGTLRLQGVDVEHLDVESTSITQDPTMRSFVTRAVRRSVEELVIHTFTPQQMQDLRSRGMAHVSMQVRDHEVVLRFGDHI